MAIGGGSTLLQAAQEHLHPAERRAAETLIDAGPELLRLPVAQLADVAGVSQATFVRLAKRLGYPGFREFRLELARQPERSTPGTVFEAVSPGDAPERVAEKIAGMSVAVIDETCRLVDAPAVSRVVVALAQAPRIDVYGVGASGLVAVDASAKLRRVGLPAWSYPDAHQQAQSASLLTKGCVAIAFSHSGETDDILRAAALSRSSGATVVVVTSFPLSALAQAADEVLLTGATKEPTERSGSTLARLSQLYVTDVLTAVYSVEHPAQSRDALRRTTAAVGDRRARDQRPSGGDGQ